MNKPSRTAGFWLRPRSPCRPLERRRTIKTMSILAMTTGPRRDPPIAVATVYLALFVFVPVLAARGQTRTETLERPGGERSARPIDGGRASRLRVCSQPRAHPLRPGARLRAALEWHGPGFARAPRAFSRSGGGIRSSLGIAPANQSNRRLAPRELARAGGETASARRCSRHPAPRRSQSARRRLRDARRVSVGEDRRRRAGRGTEAKRTAQPANPRRRSVARPQPGRAARRRAVRRGVPRRRRGRRRSTVVDRADVSRDRRLVARCASSLGWSEESLAVESPSGLAPCSVWPERPAGTASRSGSAPSRPRSPSTARSWRTAKGPTARWSRSAWQARRIGRRAATARRRWPATSTTCN